MKTMINTIGKKIHTLVKENTPLCHKIRQECGFTQTGHILLHIIVFKFLPHCCVNIGRGVRLMLPNTYQEIYYTHNYKCLSFSKTCQNVCLYNYKKY